MHILIVEDNAFNAFCLTRLIQELSPSLQVSVASNSYQALSIIVQHLPLLIVVDGNLQPKSELHCNGPALVDTIWSVYPHLSIIIWTDSYQFRQAFLKVFKQHSHPFNEYYHWGKVVTQERIAQSLNYLKRKIKKMPYIASSDQAINC